MRAQHTVNVILKAEERMAQERDSERLFAQPDMVLGIVNGASWAETEWMQNLWAGLLMTSCTQDGQDDSNWVFINMLSQLATISNGDCAHGRLKSEGRDNGVTRQPCRRRCFLRQKR